MPARRFSSLIAQVWKLQPDQWMLCHRMRTRGFIVCTHCSYSSHPMSGCKCASISWCNHFKAAQKYNGRNGLSWFIPCKAQGTIR